MKKLSTIVIAAALLLLSLTQPFIYGAEAGGGAMLTESAEHLSFYYEDELLEMPAYLVDGEIYVPVRSIAGVIGFETSFLAEQDTVVLDWRAERVETDQSHLLSFVETAGREVIPSGHRLYTGAYVSLDLWKIGGYNFVRLEDAGELMGYLILDGGDGKIVLTEDLFYTLGEEELQAYGAYLETNNLALDTSDLTFPDKSVFENYDVFLVGENHAVSMNNDVHLFFIKYLHENFGVRYILRESGFVDTMWENTYLETGDASLIDAMVSGNRGSSAYTKESYDFLEALYQYNRTLPEGEKLFLLGIDVQHNVDGGIDFINKLYAEWENKPEQAQKDFETLQAVENREDFYAFAKSVRDHEGLYKESLGEDYLTLKYSVESVRQSLEFYSVSDFELRESFIHENFSNMIEDYGAGKLFGMFGGAHTILDGTFNDLPNLASYINDQVPETKGKVCSILVDYNNCYNMDKQTGQPQRVQSAWSEKVSNLMAGIHPEESLVLFPIDREGTPFDQSFLDSFQFYLSMRNSAAATPYGPLSD